MSLENGALGGAAGYCKAFLIVYSIIAMHLVFKFYFNPVESTNTILNGVEFSEAPFVFLFIFFIISWVSYGFSMEFIEYHIFDVDNVINKFFYYLFYGWIMPLWAIVVVPYLVLGMLPIGMFCIIFGLEFEFLERSVFDIFYWVTRLSLVALCIVFSPLILVYYIIAVYMGSAECPPLDYATRIYEKRKYLSSFKEQDKIDDKTTYRSESKRERIVRHYLTKKSRVEFFNENYLLPRLRSYSDNKILNFK